MLKKNDKVYRWPEDLYHPSHMFILTLPEEERMKHLRRSEKDVALTVEDLQDYEYRIPIEYNNLREFIQKMINAHHSLRGNLHRYYAYLSDSYGLVRPWMAQRRPNIHSDGF